MPSKPSLFATLALVALLGFAGSAQALIAPTPRAVLPFAAPSPPEEEEGEAEASESEEAEAEECEVGEDEECEEAKGDSSSVEAPPECLLSSAEATVIAFGNRGRVRLQVRYTTTAPTAVTVAYGLHGSKGSLYLGSEKKRFGKRGVLRLNKSLTEPQMAKVLAAKDFTVRIRAQGAPGWCQPYLDRHLDVRRATPSGLTWLQSE